MRFPWWLKLLTSPYFFSRMFQSKLFLDDERDPPDTFWAVVRSFDEFCAWIREHGMPDVISFDHDLALEHYAAKHSPGEPIPYSSYREKTGYDCAVWLVANYGVPRHWLVHSMNPAGAANIRKVLFAGK